MNLKFGLIVIHLLLSITVHAQLKIPNYFGDDMILQRKQPVKIWGWTTPKQNVSIQFNSQEYKAVASADSIWEITLPIMEAGGPYEINIKSGGKVISFANVYFGDVWFCSGQSNMNFRVKMVKDHDKELLDTDYPQIRQLQVSQTTALTSQSNVRKAQWFVANAKTIDSFSAVAWFFAKELYKKYGVPIGIIHSSWGGSPIETFMSAASLRDFPVAKQKIDSISPAYINGIKARNKELIDAAPAGTKQPKGFVNVDNHYPTLVYNAMIAPFFSYRIKGVLWYQGEHNRILSSCYDYEAMLTGMINSWRISWENKNLPFLIVQLANYGMITEKPESSGWAIIQEAQFKVSKTLNNTALIVTNDLGEPNEIHPTNKQDVGKRLAIQARKIAYGENQMVTQGPTIRKVRITENKMEVSFDNIGSGLISKNGSRWLEGFAIAAADNKFYRAKGEIRNNKVIVWSQEVPKPVNLRYAFESSPALINFYNKDGFPAVPFRTDQLKDATKTH